MASMLMSTSALSNAICSLTAAVSACAAEHEPEYVAAAGAAGDDAGVVSKNAFLAGSLMKS